LDYLEKSTWFVDVDQITNGNKHRRELVEDVRRRFLG